MADELTRFLEVEKIPSWITCAFGITANCLVIYVVLRFWKMRTVTDIYIFNLAIADMLFLIAIPFFPMERMGLMIMAWPFGRVTCKLISPLFQGNFFVKSLLLVVMSVHKYLDDCRQISSLRYGSLSATVFFYLTAWTTSILLMVPLYMYADAISNGETTYCYIFWSGKDFINGIISLQMYLFLLGFAIPLVFTLIFHYLIISNLQNGGSANQSDRKETTDLVLLLNTVYVMCWLPFWIFRVYYTFSSDISHRSIKIMNYVFLVTKILAFGSPAINPVLYVLNSQHFRKSFVKAFTCKTRKNSIPPNNEDNDLPRSFRTSSSLPHSHDEQTAVDSLELRPPPTLTSRSSIVV